ncbi:MAG: glycosyltransferase [Cyanobacteria bacterium SZAS-4]|nr:glycosyltransferase [Cyanobacteria bacterium SZAS-4]
MSKNPACPFSSETPRVTIVTPSYNQGKFIERTILSVLKQDYTNIQYIVLDSLSTDETHSILDRYRSKISIVVEAKDKGQADAINKGFASGDGEILAYLNSDDCFASPHTVSNAVQFLVSNPDVDVVYGKRYYIDINGYFFASYPYRAFDEAQLNMACYLPQECTFWTKSIYEKAGSKVNEDYHFAMDYELWLRFLKHGARFRSVDSVYGYFRWYEGQKSTEEWVSTGLPEIAKLQREYFGINTPPDVMSDIFMEHYSTVSKLKNFDRFTFYDKLWIEEVKLKQMLCRFAPVDHWVFKRPK